MRRGRIYLPDKIPKFRIVHDELKELRILPSTLRFAGKKEIVHPDGRGAESVCFDDVRAGLEIARMNFVDDGRPGQEQELDAPFQIFAFPIAEAGPAIIGFGQLVLLDHRAHGAIEHDDALAHQRFERMEDF